MKPWKNIVSGSTFWQRDYDGRNIGHVAPRSYSEDPAARFVALLNGNVLGVCSTQEQACAMVDASAATKRQKERP